MEPSTNVDGDGLAFVVFFFFMRLQWSRRRTSTETRATTPSWR